LEAASGNKGAVNGLFGGFAFGIWGWKMGWGNLFFFVDFEVLLDRGR